MNAPRFPTSMLGAKVLACTFHCMTAPGFDEALLAGVDLLGETLVRVGREELALVFTYVSGVAHGSHVPLLVKGVFCGDAEGDLRVAGQPASWVRVHEVLHDLLTPVRKEHEESGSQEILTYGGRTALATASALALVPDGGELLREAWQGFFEDAPQQARMLAALRGLHNVPPGTVRHHGSQA